MVDALRGIDLFKAIDKGNGSLAELAISVGVDIEARNYEGMTPLHVAIEKRDWYIAKLLMREGANCYTFGQKGLSILSSMRLDGSEEAIEIFNLLQARFLEQAPK